MTTILLSYNEVQTLARKAAGGSGLPHGAAEDIGHAAVWLSARGVDAIGIVVAALCDDGLGRQAVLRDQAAIDALCSGDVERVLPGDGTCRPLLVGLAGAAASDTGLNLAAEQENGHVLPLSAVRDASCLAADMRALRRLADGGLPARVASARPAATDATAYETALGLAARTYVPASDLSRDRGAGAGTTDND